MLSNFDKVECKVLYLCQIIYASFIFFFFKVLYCTVPRSRAHTGPGPSPNHTARGSQAHTGPGPSPILALGAGRIERSSHPAPSLVLP